MPRPVINKRIADYHVSHPSPRPIHLSITMIKWIQTSRLSINKRLADCHAQHPPSSLSSLLLASLELSDTQVYEA